MQVAVREGEPGAAVILTDVAKAFERVLLIVAGCQTMKFVFSQTITAFLPERKWSCLQLKIVLRDAVTEPTNPHVDVQIHIEVSVRSM